MDDSVRKQPTKTSPTLNPLSVLKQAQEQLDVDLIGERVGNYRLIQFLERGGFADVYLGEHIHLNTLAAVKMLRTQLNPDNLSRFRNEARIIARLRHSHIVSVLDFDVQNGIPFLVMDYAPNGSLRQRHPSGSILPLSLINTYLSQIAEALDYAHTHHFIHRDIKPENMLLSWNDEILLSDFGIAVVLLTSRTDATVDIVGTAAYMSPEQFNRKALPASDQYALGVVVYEWLSGSGPFQGTPREIAAQHLNTPPPALDTHNSQVTPEIERVVLKALAKDPEQRYAKVSDFAHDFAAACAPHLGSSPAPTILANRVDHQALTMRDDLEQSLKELLSGNKRGPSRRTVLLGLGGLLTAGAVAGGIAALRLYPSQQVQSTHKTTPQPTATPVMQPGTLFHVYQGHSDNVNAVAWSPSNGLYIASASDDQTVRVWDVKTGTDRNSYTGHQDSVYDIAWSPDGQRIASASRDRTIQVWSALQGSNNTLETYRSRKATEHAVSWSPNLNGQAQYIASGGSDNAVRVWQPDNGSNVFVFRQHGDSVQAVAWSLNGQYVASGGDDQTVMVWSPLSSGDGGNDNNSVPPIVTYNHHGNSVLAVAWSPDGKYIASASADNTVQVWSALTGGSPFVTYRGHQDAVNAVAWSPDGKRVVSASNDGTVQIWDAQSGSKIYTYQGHSTDTTNPNQVYGVAWSPDGRLIASAGADKTVRVWYA
jgi:WD40 repeat protein